MKGSNGSIESWDLGARKNYRRSGHAVIFEFIGQAHFPIFGISLLVHGI